MEDVSVISADVYRGVVQTVKPDLSNFDGEAMSAWPYLIDEFVEHLQKEGQMQH